jgi:predicted nucleic acid-binding protein
LIYLDSSVALAAIFVEPRRAPPDFWTSNLISSRLLEYEVINRVHALASDAGKLAAAELLLEVTLLELSPPILARALEPFPQPVRTLDSLHLATMEFLRRHGQTVELASYDVRLNAAAVALGFPLYSW